MRSTYKVPPSCAQGLAVPVQFRWCPLTTSYGQGSSTARPAVVGSVDPWPDESGRGGLLG